MIHIVISWVMEPCRLPGGYRSFGEAYFLHLHFPESGHRCSTPTRHHGAIAQNNMHNTYIKQNAENSRILWDITPCSPLKTNRYFRGTCRLHLQGRRITEAWTYRLCSARYLLYAGFLLRMNPGRHGGKSVTGFQGRFSINTASQPFGSWVPFPIF
jgi:hypothetical protein